MKPARAASRQRVAFQFQSFLDFPLTHGMSARVPTAPAEGQVAHSRGSDPEIVELNRTAFLDELGIDPTALTVGWQVHGTRVQLVETEQRGRGRYPAFDGFLDTDGLITRSADVALGIIISDCTPILVYDPVQHAVGLAHAGWRGTVAGIARTLTDAMVDSFDSRPEDLRAGIGPSIGPCCYEVGPEVIDAWHQLRIPGGEDAVVERRPRPHFDLWRANELVLEFAGLSSENIERADLCTRCESDRFFSHRAAIAGERPKGSMIMVAKLHRA